MSDDVLAIDIGGTKLAAALVRPTGDVVVEAQRPTDAVVGGVPRDAEAIQAGLDEVLAEVLGGVGAVAGVGIGSAGPVEVRQGTISPLNIPRWRRHPVVARIASTLERLGVDAPPGVLIGDGHCVALGEQWLGAGRGHDSIIGVTCSTGVGAGVVLSGRAYQGRSGNAVHVGHVCVDVGGRACACGARGCVEALASGPSMTAIARERGWRGEDARELTRDARAGDEVALAVIDEGMRALGAGLAGLATVFDVPTVVVGGGVSRAGEVVLAPLRRHFAEFCRLSYVADEATVLPATLPNAGLLGAARAALATA